MRTFKWAHFSKEIILLNVSWYLRYALSYRDLEDMPLDRGLKVDHSTIQRWVIKYAPALEGNSHKKRPVSGSWRMDETYIKINGKWTYLYRAVDKEGKTIDYFLSAKRDKKSARSFFDKAIGNNGRPEKINIDKSGSNIFALEDYNEENKCSIEIRQCKYLNNIVEQDHRFIKRIVRPMLGFKSFASAKITLGGIEISRMSKKKQFEFQTDSDASLFQEFCLMIG